MMTFVGSPMGTWGGITLVKIRGRSGTGCRGTSPGLIGSTEFDLAAFLFSSLVSSVAGVCIEESA